MSIHFSPAGAFPHQIWIEGLSAQGQREITVPLMWPVEDSRDQQMTRLLKVIEDYISSQPKHITAGQTMHYGWKTLRFVPAIHDENSTMLQIEEIQHPFSHNNPTLPLAALPTLGLPGTTT